MLDEEAPFRTPGMASTFAYLNISEYQRSNTLDSDQGMNKLDKYGMDSVIQNRDFCSLEMMLG